MLRDKLTIANRIKMRLGFSTSDDFLRVSNLAIPIYLLVATTIFDTFASAQSLCVFPASEEIRYFPFRATTVGRAGFAGDSVCQECHSELFRSYVATSHHLTSRLPSSGSIAGDFTRGNNVLNTINPELSFKMENANGHFYETALVHKRGRIFQHREQIDVVIGSATKGQTYLYWKVDALFELPVSYWTELNHWVNSPGYVDGSADFDRPVTPRCIECHATYLQQIDSAVSENRYKVDTLIPGISCERCHGPGTDHVLSHKSSLAALTDREPMAPIGLPRDRQMDICAQCHGGVGESVAPAFSFRPGETLGASIKLQEPTATDRLDVHGNQVALLERSRCFLESSNMTCSTCHDVHAPERPAASYSEKCLHCHEAKQCGRFKELGSQIVSNCIDCHMPVQSSNLLVLDADDSRIRAKVRNHWIRAYAQGDLP